MSSAFDACFEILIGHEGGYSNDSRDPGGETRYGICKRVFPALDIKTLTLDAARDIYRERYWQPICGDKLPAGLALLLFDAAVNCGVDTAIIWLQRACKVSVDGQLGPKTIAAASLVGIDQAFHLERVKAMTAMRNWPTFSRGWAIRLATLPFQAAELDR
jgi:lysozyme family protein